MAEYLECNAYLQVRKHNNWYRDEARVMKVTQKRPEVVEAGHILVKVRLRIPAGAWGPFEPEATIEIPEELIQRPITVTAEEPAI